MSDTGPMGPVAFWVSVEVCKAKLKYVVGGWQEMVKLLNMYASY